MTDPIAALGREARAERAGAELTRAGAETTLREAANQFEAYLLGQIFSQASQPLTKQPLLDGGSATRMYRELYIQEVAGRVGERGGLGIAKLLEAGAQGEPEPEAVRGAAAPGLLSVPRTAARARVPE